MGNSTKFRGVAVMIGVSLLVGCMAIPERMEQRQVALPVYPPPPETPRFFYERTLTSSADVVPDAKGAAFRRLVTGEHKAGEGMAKPYGLAVRAGRIYVADTVRKEVLVFDAPGGQFSIIGADEPGLLGMPLGLDLDAAGNLYVVDGTLKRVMVYDARGKYLRALGVNQLSYRPSGIATDPEGKRIYVVETGELSGEGHRVRVFDTASGEHMFDIGKRGNGEGELNLPRDAALAPNGELYVVDGGNFRVQVFTSDGRFLRSFGSVGQQGGQFSRPKELAVDRSGRVYVADAAFGNFQIFEPDGRLLLNVGSRSARPDPGKFMLPAGLAVDIDGRVYMVDQFHRKIDVFRPAELPANASHAGLEMAEK